MKTKDRSYFTRKQNRHSIKENFSNKESHNYGRLHLFYTRRFTFYLVVRVMVLHPETKETG